MSTFADNLGPKRPAYPVNEDGTFFVDPALISKCPLSKEEQKARLKRYEESVNSLHPKFGFKGVLAAIFSGVLAAIFSGKDEVPKMSKKEIDDAILLEYGEVRKRAT